MQYDDCIDYRLYLAIYYDISHIAACADDAISCCMEGVPHDAHIERGYFRPRMEYIEMAKNYHADGHGVGPHTKRRNE